MWIANEWKDYEVLDCTSGEKLERWDKQYLVRPDPRSSGKRPGSIPAGGNTTPAMNGAIPAAVSGTQKSSQINGRSIIKS